MKPHPREMFFSTKWPEIPRDRNYPDLPYMRFWSFQEHLSYIYVVYTILTKWVLFTSGINHAALHCEEPTFPQFGLCAHAWNVKWRSLSDLPRLVELRLAFTALYNHGGVPGEFQLHTGDEPCNTLPRYHLWLLSWPHPAERWVRVCINVIFFRMWTRRLYNTKTSKSATRH